MTYEKLSVPLFGCIDFPTRVLVLGRYWLFYLIRQSPGVNSACARKVQPKACTSG